jgi:hypothetical protein
MDSNGGSTVSEKRLLALTPRLSVTVTLKVNVPVVVGLPLTAPADSNDMPGGIGSSEDHEYGGAPPEASNSWRYAVPTRARGKVASVVISSLGSIVRENNFEAISPAESLTCTTKA